jgi:hypothetical protein
MGAPVGGPTRDWSPTSSPALTAAFPRDLPADRVRFAPLPLPSALVGGDG